MKELDRVIRSYGNSYAPSEFTASINLKQLSNDTEEDNFIVEGIEKIIGNSNDKVAVLVRAGNQGKSIAVKLKEKEYCILMLCSKIQMLNFLNSMK